LNCTALCGMTNFPKSFDFYTDMKGIGIHNIDTKLFLRTERQTFRMLKNTNHIAFGIKVYVEPIRIVKKSPAIAEDLLVTMRTMSDEQKNGLGIQFVEKPLRTYLKQVLEH